MILELRRRHRRMLLPLGVACGVLFALALRARVESLPLAEVNAKQALGSQPASAEGELHGLWTELPMHCVLAADGSLHLGAKRDLGAPDVLLYWSGSPNTGGLPTDAQLLGRVVSTRVERYELPAAAQGQRSYLYLYSLARAEVLDSAELPPEN